MSLPRGFSDEVRQQADIVRVASDYLTLKKKGGSHWACCPFHQEKSPSFHVNGARQFFKCFGCGKAGDIFTFVMEIESCSFPEAVRTVAEKMGIPVPAGGGEADVGHDEAERRRSELLHLNQQAVAFFEKSLTESIEGRVALDYLASRGITPETRKAFRLGYAPNGWDGLSSYLRSQGASRQQIETSGLVTLRENGSGFYDRFRGRLMIPITNPQGRVIAFGGRIIGEGEPKYLNSPETAIYTKGNNLFGLYHAREAIRQRGFVILVEGYLDFLVPFQAGVRNIVASLGTALTETQVRLLGRYVRQVVVNFDPDAAGVSATKRSLEMLLQNGFRVNVLTLPDNLDPDEFIQQRGAEGYLAILKTSSRFLDFIVDQSLRVRDVSTPDGKVEAINEILPYLRLVGDRIERAEYVDRIADRLKIESRLIREEFRRAVETRRTQVSELARQASTPVKPAERTLLTLLLADKSLRSIIIPLLKREDFAELRTERIFESLIDFERRGVDPDWSGLSRALEGDEMAQDLLSEFLSGDEALAPVDRDDERGDDAPDDNNGGSGRRADYQTTTPEQRREELRRRALESLHGLRSLKLVERLNALQIEINQAQRADDPSLLISLLQRKIDLAREQQELAKWQPG